MGRAEPRAQQHPPRRPRRPASRQLRQSQLRRALHRLPLPALCRRVAAVAGLRLHHPRLSLARLQAQRWAASPSALWRRQQCSILEPRGAPGPPRARCTRNQRNKAASRSIPYQAPSSRKRVLRSMTAVRSPLSHVQRTHRYRRVGSNTPMEKKRGILTSTVIVTGPYRALIAGSTDRHRREPRAVGPLQRLNCSNT